MPRLRACQLTLRPLFFGRAGLTGGLLVWTEWRVMVARSEPTGWVSVSRVRELLFRTTVFIFGMPYFDVGVRRCISFAFQ